MKKTVLLATAAVFAFAAGAASAAGIQPTSAGFNVSANPVFHSPRGAKTLYNQNSNNSNVGLLSANFTSGVDGSYSAQDADDFVVPSGKAWKVGEVDVTGVYFGGTGPATSEDIYFYKDKSGMPGKGVRGGSFTGLSCTDSSGSFTCVLPTKVKLKPGHYWVSVVANMNFSGGAGEWGWEGNSTIQNDAAMWQNPGGSFGFCKTWGTNSSCLGYAQDDMFDLKT